MASHLGYRYVLNETNINYDENFDLFNINIDLKNVGFGSLCKEKKTTLFFVDDENNILSFDQGYFGINNTNYIINSKIDAKHYKVYLGISNEVVDNKCLYPVKFANIETFNDVLKANYIGEIGCF